jgi:hypothetical protein
VVLDAKARGNRHAIRWNSDAIRRATSAIREAYSKDFYVMARRALEAAVRTEADLLALHETTKPPPQGKAPAPVHAVAAHA